MQYKFLATCPTEIQDSLTEELKGLGVSHIEQQFKAVVFTAPKELSYRLHLCTRTASRLLRVIKECRCNHIGAVTKQSSRINWHDFITNKHEYLIEAVVADRGPRLPTGNELSKAVRLGLEDYFLRHSEEPPRVNLKEPDVRIIAFLRAGELVISLDSTGKTMHKRGYRGEGHPAPIKETLAAALLAKMGYSGKETFFDPMCGSGTIAIEAAMIALNKAPLIHRKKGEFGLEHLVDFDKSLWRSVQDEIRGEKSEQPSHPIIAKDIDRHYVESAQDNALRARTEKYMQFSTGDFFEDPAPDTGGLLLTNLPYGERIETGMDDSYEAYYKRIGDKLKRDYQGWRIGLLVSEDSPYKMIGLRPKRKIPILNGSLKCRLLIFEIYAGSRKTKPI
jgi:putative N6-adenine-specific DNA methylase